VRTCRLHRSMSLVSLPSTRCAVIDNMVEQTYSTCTPDLSTWLSMVGLKRSMRYMLCMVLHVLLESWSWTHVWPASIKAVTLSVFLLAVMLCSKTPIAHFVCISCLAATQSPPTSSPK